MKLQLKVLHIDILLLSLSFVCVCVNIWFDFGLIAVFVFCLLILLFFVVCLSFSFHRSAFFFSSNSLHDCAVDCVNVFMYSLFCSSSLLLLNRNRKNLSLKIIKCSMFHVLWLMVLLRCYWRCCGGGGGCCCCSWWLLFEQFVSFVFAVNGYCRLTRLNFFIDEI